MEKIMDWDLGSNKCDVESILSRLRLNGFVVLKNYLTLANVLKLRKEFHRFFELSASAFVVGRDQLECNNLRVKRSELPADEFPLCKELFGSPVFHQLSDRFFSGQEYLFNDEIFVCYHFETESPLKVLPYLNHFDCIQTLKFFFYVEDIGVDDGPFTVYPGSNVVNKKTREAYIEQGLNLVDIPNVIEAADLGLPLTGAAGTLVIFDTDTTHRAGHVKPGHSRKIIRGHTRLLESLRRFGA